MMTQSVMTQAATKLTANTSVNASASKGKQSTNGFDLIMTNNLKTARNTDQNMSTDTMTAAKKDVDPKADSPNDKSVKNEENASDQTTDALQDSNQVSSKDAKKTDQTNETKAEETTQADSLQEKDTSVEDGVIDEQLAEQIAGMFQQIQDTVMKTLNLSPEELNQLLKDQRMNITDLLQPEKLQQLVLASSGQTDILSVLTDEKLAFQMKELIQNVETIKSDTKLNLSNDQLNALLIQKDTSEPVISLADVKKVTLQLQQSKKSETDKPVLDQTELPAETVVKESDTTKENIELHKDNDTAQITETVSKESGTGGAQEDRKGQENKDLKASDQFQLFIDNLVGASKENQVDYSGDIAKVTQLREIADQIIEHVKVSVSSDQSSMELQLTPENLGKVNLTIQSKNGSMTAHFVVQNEVSKEAIESQIQTLRETLNNQGIKVDAIEVTVANYNFNENNQQNASDQTNSQRDNSGKRISLEEALLMNDAEDETLADNLELIRGSNIDYTA